MHCCKNYWTHLHENCTTDVSVDKEEVLKFWKSSTFGSVHKNFFLKDSPTLWDGHFSTIWLISLHILVLIGSDRIRIWTPDMDSGSGPNSPCIGLHSRCALGKIYNQSVNPSTSFSAKLSQNPNPHIVASLLSVFRNFCFQRILQYESLVCTCFSNTVW